MKNYNSHDLSRKKFKDIVNKQREIKKAVNHYGRYLVDEEYINGERKSRTKPYVRRFYRGRRKGSCSSYYKKVSNRAVRRLPLETEIGNNASYRRVFDYWWTID